MPRSHRIIAQFHDYGAAHRALSELLQIGVLPNHVSIIAGDRSNSHGANRDFGILAGEADIHMAAVRRGRTLLAVQADAAEHPAIVEIIEQYAPRQIEEKVA